MDTPSLCVDMLPRSAIHVFSVDCGLAPILIPLLSWWVRHQDPAHSSAYVAVGEADQIHSKAVER